MNLGLIPSSEESWETACAALRCERGGILHIHGNVTRNREKKTTKEVGVVEEVLEDSDEKMANDVMLKSEENELILDYCDYLATCDESVKLYSLYSNWVNHVLISIFKLFYKIYNKCWKLSVKHIDRKSVV